MLDLADYPAWQWRGKRDKFGIDAALIARKDARVNGQVYVSSYRRAM